MQFVVRRIRYLFRFQLAIEVFSLSATRQPPFSAFSCFPARPSNLLHARVIIAPSFENPSRVAVL